MESNIKVSVIVPVYNAEKYLNNCLDSLLAQSLNEIEIIAVDDLSTDNSFNILKEYENRNRGGRLEFFSYLKKDVKVLQEI